MTPALTMLAPLLAAAAFPRSMAVSTASFFRRSHAPDSKARRARAGCPAGYAAAAGDVAGWDQFGREMSNLQDSISLCADDCNSRADCRSFEWSPRTKICSLNRGSSPDLPSFEDYTLCVRTSEAKRPDAPEDLLSSMPGSSADKGAKEKGEKAPGEEHADVPSKVPDPIADMIPLYVSSQKEAVNDDAAAATQMWHVAEQEALKRADAVAINVTNQMRKKVWQALQEYQTEGFLMANESSAAVEALAEEVFASAHVELRREAAGRLLERAAQVSSPGAKAWAAQWRGAAGAGPCPSGYSIVAGDVPGKDQFGLEGRKQATIYLCAAECDHMSGCRSFEWSQSTEACNLNKVAVPSAESFQDFVFCQRAA
mmetsp:Transcript_92763/g.262344  ORF Transcript_92763/g.262344 Transcript_92763/m.262344 type:complete len:370 (-) Transcript_92763:86-1195(-)